MAHPTTIQTSRPPIVDVLSEYVEKARKLDPSVMGYGFAEEHPFLHTIRCSVNLLSASQKKSRLIELLAMKRALVLGLVELEAEYDPIRCELQEEEGHDTVEALCKAHYGVGDGRDVASELAVAYMELTFRPLSFPGLDVEGSAADKGRHRLRKS